MSLYIAGWRKLAKINGDKSPIVSEHPDFEDVVAVSGTTAQSEQITSTPASDSGYYVRLRADETCHIAIGVNPTATTANTLKLGAGDVEWIGVPNGQRIAVIAGA